MLLRVYLTYSMQKGRDLHQTFSNQSLSSSTKSKLTNKIKKDSTLKLHPLTKNIALLSRVAGLAQLIRPPLTGSSLSQTSRSKIVILCTPMTRCLLINHSRIKRFSPMPMKKRNMINPLILLLFHPLQIKIKHSGSKDKLIVYLKSRSRNAPSWMIRL